MYFADRGIDRLRIIARSSNFPHAEVAVFGGDQLLASGSLRITSMAERRDFLSHLELFTAMGVDYVLCDVALDLEAQALGGSDDAF
jgi:hypothetical protein